MATELRDYIRKILETQGPMPFSRFMELCLYHPGIGYYRKPVFPGTRHGDFVTSPQASRFFGYLMAEQFFQMADILGMQRVRIVEMGAGTGIFARDVLEYSEERGKGGSVSYIIVEPFENLRRLQEDTLSGLSGVEWVSDISETRGIEGIVFSNELLDSFPVEVIEIRNGIFHRIGVAVSGTGDLVETLLPLDHEELMDYVESSGLDRMDEGYRTEVNLAMRSWLNKVSEAMERGFLVTVDYGYPASLYFHPSRKRGTLLGYSGHETTEDFYSCPGEVDMTSHVNFSDLCRWGKEVGFNPVGYTHQWAFLAGQDIERVVSRYGEEPYSPLNAGLKMLLLPGGMGESHKVLVQEKGVGSVEISGFRLLNKIQELGCGDI